MRFSRKFARSFSKTFSRGFAGSSGSIFDILKKYYQYVFTGKSNEIVPDGSGGWAYENYGTGGELVRASILDTQIATFDGIAYLQGNINQFNEWDIYSHVGTSTPTIDYDNDRIIITAGELENFSIINHEGVIETFYLQESNGVIVYTDKNNTNPCFDSLSYQAGIYSEKYLKDLDTERANNAKLISSNSLFTNGVNNVGKLTNRLTHLLNTENSWEIEYFFKRQNLGDEIILADWNNFGFALQINGANQVQLVMRKTASTDELYVRSSTTLTSLTDFYKLNIKYDGSKLTSGVTFTINSTISGNSIVANTLTSSDITPSSTGSEILSRTDISFYSSTNAVYLSVYSDRQAIPKADILDIGFSEGEDNIAYDSSQQLNHAVFDGNQINLWSIKQDVYHKNILNGFDLWVDDLITPTKFLRVPFDNEGNSIKTDGDTIASFVWKGKNSFAQSSHNNSETRLDFTDDNRNFYPDSYEGDEVIVMAGQSMVAGYNNNEQPISYLKQPNENAQIVGINNGIKEVSTFEVIDFDTSNNMGEIAGFELMLAYKFGTKKIWIIKVCQGGTDLHTDWATGSTLRNKLIDYINYAKGELTNPRFNFYWGQWYDSVQNASSYNNYKTDFDGLVNEVETTCAISFNSFTLESVNTNANQYISYPVGGNVIITAQNQIALERNGILIDISDQILWDGTHLTNEGFNTLAERIFEQGLIPKISLGLFSNSLNNYGFGDNLSELNKSFFRREKSEVDEDRYLIYSEDITGSCLQKTLKYLESISYIDTLTVINPPINFWDSKSDTAYPALLKYGYDVLAEIGDEENEDKWIYVILNNGQSQTDIDIPAGYAYSHQVKPNAGFSNTGNTLAQPIDDAGLNALFDAYSIPYPQITYSEMKGLKTSNLWTIKKTNEAILRLKSIYQDVFGNTPINNEFVDQIGNNNITIKNNQVLTLNGIEEAFTSINRYVYLVDGFKLSIDVQLVEPLESIPKIVTNQTTAGNFDGDFSLRLRNNGAVYIYWRHDGIESNIFLSDVANILNWRTVEIEVIETRLHLSIIQENGVITTTSTELGDIGTPDTRALGFATNYSNLLDGTLPCKIKRISADLGGENILLTNCINSIGNELFDESGNGNDCDINTNDDSGLWANFYDSDYPALCSNDYSLYNRISDNEKLKVIKPIDNNIYVFINSGQSNANRMGTPYRDFVAPYLPADVGEDDIYEYQGMICIDNSMSGQAIAYWDKNTNADGWDRLENCVNRVNAYANSIGKTPIYLSMSWLQGESDIDQGLEAQYGSAYNNLINNINTLIPNIPFQAYRLSDNNGQSSASKLTINTVFEDTAININNINTPFDTDGLTFEDTLHYSTDQHSILRGWWFDTFIQPNIHNTPSSDYEFIAEIPAGSVSDTGNLFDGILGIGKDTDATFEDIDAIEIIPKEDFTINNEGDAIKDMASNIDNFVVIHNGEIVTHNGETVFP